MSNRNWNSMYLKDSDFPEGSTIITRHVEPIKKRKKTEEEDLKEHGYSVGKQLGEGSYCKVKAAIYNGCSIAVKIITRDCLSMDFESKFLPREIDILSKIRHENVIRVYKIFSYPRKVYIFMELISRGDLLNFIRNRGRLMEPEACHYFNQMVSALQYLHQLNVSHRDLKCENIMITKDEVIKIIDFGFCRNTRGPNGRRQLSQTYCGSTAYAAPEVLQGIPYNPMMYDVWSLGCVLFIMVTGTMPFDDSNVRRMVSSQLKRQVRYPNHFIVSKEVKELISRMLEPDVCRRANLNQVSSSQWAKDNQDHFMKSRSTHKDTTDGASSSIETGTQTINLDDF